MTLGRTSSGAIKIKTDGGLRAVGCACCNPCGCRNISIPEPLRTVFANATSVIIGGQPLSFYYQDPVAGYWEGEVFDAGMIYEIGFGGTCLGGRLDYYSQATGQTLAFFGASDQCSLEDATGFTDATFTINGEVFPYFYVNGINIPDPPFVISYGVAPPPNMTVS
jgi:hypothetical protein